MGLLSDVFSSPAIADKLIAGNSISYNQQPVPTAAIERYDIPISQLQVAQIEEALISAYYTGNVINEDQVLQREGWDIYDNMLLYDAHLFSIAEGLTRGAANTPFRIIPSSIGDDHAEMLKTFVETVFGSFDIVESLKQIAYAKLIGYSVSEMVYAKEPIYFDGKKKKTLAAISRISSRKIAFDLADEPKLLTRRNSVFGDRLPSWKFIVMKCGNGFYGEGLLQHCYPAWWYKRNSQRFLAMFLERWGNPPVIGYFKGSGQDVVLNALKELRSSSYAAFPDGDTIPDVLQPQHDTNFIPALNFWNDEMTKVFESGTRQQSASNAPGAKSATETHSEQADEQKEALAKGLCVVVNRQIIPEIIKLNFGVQKAYPKMVLGVLEEESPNEYVDRLLKVAQAKVKVEISRKEFYERSGFSAPDQDTLNDSLMIEGAAISAVN